MQEHNDELDIYNFAENNFKSLQRNDEIKTPHAGFYWYPSKRNPEALIKVFQEKDSNRYWTEIKALQMLRKTKRVCPVHYITNEFQIFSSDFEGPYFIAKPFYRLTLDAALTTAPDLDKLDIAAQLVDIAREFNNCGYYDYDWRKENDVIDQNGRVLRIDLDAALYVRGWLDKKWTVGDPTFYVREHSRNLMQWDKSQKDFYDNFLAYEVSNMAVRLSSNIFFNREAGELDTLVSDLQPAAENPNGESATASKRYGARIINTSGNLLRKAIRAKTNGNHDNRNDINVFDLWIDKWLAKYNSAGKAHLRKIESETLARLFYHLISNPGHGFTLDDLYNSLVILEIDFLRARIATAQSASEQETVKNLAPNTSFFEIRKALQMSLDNTSSVKALKSELQPPKPQPKGAQVNDIQLPTMQMKYKVDSGYWLGFKKPSQQCEDFAFSDAHGNFAFAVVADGATGANGFEAQEVIRNMLAPWVETLKKTPVTLSVDKVEESLNTLFTQIQGELIGRSEKTNGRYQAHLIAALIYQIGSDCYISIAQAGKDSVCMILLPDGSLLASTLDWQTDAIGSSSYSNKQFHIEHTKLNHTKSYRVRLFSDGVGEIGTEQIRQISDISLLVEEAGQWQETISENIGHDDWSVAGVDISFEGKTPTPPAQKTPKTKDESSKLASETQEQNTLFSVVKSTPASRFNLSEPARRFWRNELIAIANKYGNIELNLMSEVAGHNSVQGVRAKPTENDFRAPSEDSKIYDLFFGKKFSAATLLGILFAFPLLFLGAWWFMSSPDQPQPDNSVATPTPSTSPSPAPTTTMQYIFEEPSQKEIYEALKDKRIYAKTKLPGGKDTSDTQLQTFLKNLAEVIKKARINTDITVYSTPGGDDQPSLDFTIKRAQAIKQFLEKQGVPPERVNTKGLGKWANNPTPQNIPADLDTTGAIILIKRTD